MGGTPMVTNYEGYYARRAARCRRRSWPLTLPTGVRVTAHGHPGSAWSRFARSYRQRHPLCAACERQGRVTASEQVDHQIPLSAWTGGKYDESNLQALCSTCHSRKTVHERENVKRGGGGGGSAPWPLVRRSLAAKVPEPRDEWGDLLSGGRSSSAAGGDDRRTRRA